MAGKFVKGALVQFMETFLVPQPNVIIFQYNPETMTHTWSQAQAARQGWSEPEGSSNPLAVRGLPGESFSFSIAVDAKDMIAEGTPVGKNMAATSGVYARLAALEMLLYPTAAFEGGGLEGAVSTAPTGGGGGFPRGGTAGATKRTIPESQVPTVLFVWGSGRIVPVRVTQLNITEKLYDEFLNPTHAEAQLGLQVLTPEELRFVTGPLREIARGAYTYSQSLRQALAAANLANAPESIIGMLPV